MESRPLPPIHPPPPPPPPSLQRLLTLKKAPSSSPDDFQRQFNMLSLQGGVTYSPHGGDELKMATPTSHPPPPESFIHPLQGYPLPPPPPEDFPPFEHPPLPPPPPEDNFPLENFPCGSSNVHLQPPLCSNEFNHSPHCAHKPSLSPSTQHQPWFASPTPFSDSETVEDSDEEKSSLNLYPALAICGTQEDAGVDGRIPVFAKPRIHSHDSDYDDTLPDTSVRIDRTDDGLDLNGRTFMQEGNSEWKDGSVQGGNFRRDDVASREDGNWYKGDYTSRERVGGHVVSGGTTPEGYLTYTNKDAPPEPRVLGDGRGKQGEEPVPEVEDSLWYRQRDSFAFPDGGGAGHQDASVPQSSHSHGHGGFVSLHDDQLPLPYEPATKPHPPSNNVVTPPLDRMAKWSHPPPPPLEDPMATRPLPLSPEDGDWWASPPPISAESRRSTDLSHLLTSQGANIHPSVPHHASVGRSLSGEPHSAAASRNPLYRRHMSESSDRMTLALRGAGVSETLPPQLGGSVNTMQGGRGAFTRQHWGSQREREQLDGKNHLQGRRHSGIIRYNNVMYQCLVTYINFTVPLQAIR